MKILICGCGAIGSNLIDTLVRQSKDIDITVVDFDRIEEKNIGTQIWQYRDIGQLKVSVVQNYCYNVNKTVVSIFDKKVDERTVRKLTKNIDLVVDCFDNTESRKLVTDFCRANNIECVHGGLFEEYGEVIWNDNYKVPQQDGSKVCDNPLARNLILLLVSVLAEQVIRCSEESFEKRGWAITLKDLQIRKI